MKFANVLILRFITPIALGILAIGIATVIVELRLIPQWSGLVANFMKNNELATTSTRTEKLQEIVGNKFTNIKNDVSLFADYTDKLYSGNFTINNFYNGSITFPLGANEKKYSAWFNKFTNDVNQQFLNVSTLLDDPFKVFYQSNSAYQTIYIGHNTGLFRTYPYRNLNSFNTFSSICLINNQPTIGYDPRCRTWYVNALNNTDVYFTAPYTDASTGEILISISKSVKNIGVVSVDIVMTDIDSIVAQAKIMNDGYAILMDQNKNAISAPNLRRDRTYDVTTIIFGSSGSNTEKINFNNLLNNIILSGNNNVSQVEFKANHVTYYMSYTKIMSMPYYLLTIVPESDISSSSNALRNSLISLMDTNIGLFSLLGVCVFLFGMFITFRIAKYVTTPLKEFDDMTQKVNNNDLDVELGHIPEQSDLRRFHDGFKNLLRAIKFANDSYAQNNLHSAYQNYEQIEKIMKEVNNQRGLGVVWNNMGNTMKLMKDVSDNIKKAHAHLNNAIENAKSILTSTIDQNTIRMMKITLANRYMNLGLLYLEIKNIDEAEKHLKESIKIHQDVKNLLGEIKATGNLALVFMEQNRPNAVMETIGNCYERAKNAYLENKNERTLEVLQYATLNMGLHYKKIRNFVEALKYLHFTLESSPKISAQLKNTCVINLIEVCKELGMPTTQYESNMLGSVENKHVVFVVDKSGSMEADGKMIQCITSISHIILNNINFGDSVSVIAFDAYISVLINNRKINSQNDKNECIKIVDTIRAGGQTKFYDAVLNGIEIVKSDKVIKRDNIWLVSLTDGEDTSSNYNEYHVSTQIYNSKINYVNIGIGRLFNEASIRKMCNSSPKGIYIQSSTDMRSIQEAFKKVAYIIQTGQVNMESL